MNSPQIERLYDLFDDRNLFLQSLLGALSASLSFETWLRRELDHPFAAAANQGQAPAEPDPLCDVLLGLLALTRALRAHLDRAIGGDLQRGGTQRVSHPGAKVFAARLLI